MNTTDSTFTMRLTPAEAATLLTTLQQGQEAAWRSTRETRGQSAEYESRFQNAAEVDGVFRDIMRETAETGMRRPGEPVEEFAERAESEARQADARRAKTEMAVDVVAGQAIPGASPERAAIEMDLEAG